MSAAVILVIGSGRSGTHWLGKILASHSRIQAAIEDPRFFRPVTAMALDVRRRDELFEQLVQSYRDESEAVAPDHFADKSHPNIWLAPELAAALPDVRFVGIERSPQGTVASMLKHRGVLSWHDRWREFPVPNPFLGITEQNAIEYDAMSPVAKCVLRWQSHRTQMTQLRGLLGKRLHVLDYEDLLQSPGDNVARLQQALGLSEPFPVPEPATESLDRWRQELTPDQLDEIDSLVSAVDRSR